MKTITFHKMVASGNDFLVIDNRKHMIQHPKEFAQRVCRQHLGVGADGVLLIEPSKKADFLMRIINSDGSEAEACGNGYRCVGLYAHQILGMKKSMTMETLAGNISVETNTDSVKVKMAEPKDYQPNLSFSNLKGDFINTGVPHTVLFTEDLSKIDVEKLGRPIRYHERFMPRGTNVDFVQITGKNSLRIRTYERGVEAETLACGTGSVAAAIVGSLNGLVAAPVEVLPKSGEKLNVYFDRSGDKISNIYLEGPAKFVFEGQLSLED